MERCPCETCRYNTCAYGCNHPCERYFEWYEGQDFSKDNNPNEKEK